MKQYTGTKTVKAMPMTLGEAEKLLGRKIDTAAVEKREETPGYLVEYGEDGDGYRSWSPKDVFDRAYMPRETYIERMYIEKRYLMERYLRLTAYMLSQQFVNLPEKERKLLIYQEKAMRLYLETLSDRIELAEKKEQAPSMNCCELPGELVGRTVVKAGRCDECKDEPTDCRKLELMGGGYICVK